MGTFYSEKKPIKDESEVHTIIRSMDSAVADVAPAGRDQEQPQSPMHEETSFLADKMTCSPITEIKEHEDNPPPSPMVDEMGPENHMGALPGSPNSYSADEGASSAFSSTSSSPHSRRRSRTVMTPSQTRILLAVLEETYFPTNEQREQLSKILQIPQRTIQVWFQNQRQKAKQFGKTGHPPSLPPTISSPQQMMLRAHHTSPSIEFRSPISASPLASDPSLKSTLFPSSSNSSSMKRPILFYGGSPGPNFNGEIFTATEHRYSPVGAESPIRKRPLPIRSSCSISGWESMGWKPNPNLDPYKGTYQAQRSASLPIHPIAYNRFSPQFPQAQTPSKPTPNGSPSITLSNLLQSTSLVVRDHIDEKKDEKAAAVVTSTPENAMDQFKDEEDQLELPNLLLALRG